MKKKLALVSVSDKSGLEEFAKALDRAGFEIVSTGGTAKAIEGMGLKVLKVGKVTGFPEMLEGRVKTLHPKIHAGILADRSKKGHMESLREKGIRAIDLVVVNLYPFRETVAKKGVSLREAIENIDIGGPTMVRAAAKNFASVAVATSPKQYPAIIKELEKNGKISLETRKRLASEAFDLTASYDSVVSGFLNKEFFGKERLPARTSIALEKIQDLRYGENWHQKAAFYRNSLEQGGLSSAEQLQGKELSFNNINDAGAAIGLVLEFSEPAAVLVKHTNPCGAASCAKISDAFKKALECDEKSAFGSIIALNRECDGETASLITDFFNEIVIAPSYSKQALEVFAEKKNLRVLVLPEIENHSPCKGLEFRSVFGGVLLQTSDSHSLSEKECKIVSKRKPSKEEMQGLLFAWKAAKHAKSNAIILAKGLATVGVGAGQMSRIDATEIAVKKSKGKCRGSVLASDAFFPFRDNVDAAAKAGITAIIQPGGSMRDEEVIKAADEHNMALVFTGVRHFKH